MSKDYIGNCRAEFEEAFPMSDKIYWDNDAGYYYPMPSLYTVEYDMAAQEAVTKNKMLNVWAQATATAEARAYEEAAGIATWMYDKFYADKTDAVGFELCDSTAGIITQIDNMATGILAGELDGLCEDGQRYRTLMKYGRIRILGYAGLRKHNKGDDYAHFGAEFWTKVNHDGYIIDDETRAIFNEYIDKLRSMVK